MKKKILILSVSAAVLLVIASFSSVIGTYNQPSSQKIESPLFAVRTQRSIHKESLQALQSNYLGKGSNSHLFITAKPTLATTIDRAIKFLNQNPAFFTKFMQIVTSNLRVIALLQKNGITMNEFKTHLNQIKNDPSLFIEEIQSTEPRLSATQLHDPIPLGLNTTNPFGCVITIIVMLPVVLVIALIVVFFTLRILQCMNLDEIVNNIMDQIMQELFPTGYII
jgi:hypothetical protein